MKSPVKVRTFSLAVDRNGDVAHIRKGSTPARNNGDYVTSVFYGNATAFNSAMTYYVPSSVQRTMRSGSGFGWNDDKSGMFEWRF